MRDPEIMNDSEKTSKPLSLDETDNELDDED
jgi:hypothetical protein